MGTFVLIVHVLVCILLVTIILMQSGRGGGLTEVFSSAESMFGAKTNEMLIKVTTVAAVVFFLTNISLAVINSRADRSLMSDKVVAETPQKTEGLQDAAEENVEAAAEAAKEATQASPEAE